MFHDWLQTQKNESHNGQLRLTPFPSVFLSSPAVDPPCFDSQSTCCQKLDGAARSSTEPRHPPPPRSLVVGSFCGHEWCLCCSQREQSWRMWWIILFLCNYRPFTTACWWVPHPAAVTGVSIAARGNGPGGYCGPSVIPLCDWIVQSPWCHLASGVFTGYSGQFTAWGEWSVHVSPDSWLGLYRVCCNNNDNYDHIERHSLRFLQSPHCATNCLQQVHSSCQGAFICKLCATHQVLITCSMLCAMWIKGTAQLLNLRV